MVIQSTLILLAYYFSMAEQSAMISSMMPHVQQLAVKWVTLVATAGLLVIIRAYRKPCR